MGTWRWATGPDVHASHHSGRVTGGRFGPPSTWGLSTYFPLSTFNLYQNPHLNSTAPTVNPAPTDASSTRSPFFNRPEQTASFNASGIVAAVVLPKRSMLITTFAGSRSRFSAAAAMMRRLA